MSSITNIERDRPKIQAYFFLSELNAARLIWYALKKRPVAIVKVMPLVSIIGRLLQALVDFGRSRRIVYMVFEDLDDSIRFKNYSECESQVDPFPQAEPWIEERFHFDSAEQKLKSYSTAYKHIVCNQIQDYPFLCHTVNDLIGNTDESQVPIYGMNRDLRLLYRHIFGTDCGPRVRPAIDFSMVLNLFVATGLILYSWFWVLLRTRLWTSAQTDVFLGSDFINDPRLKTFWNEVTGAGKSIRVIVRGNDHLALTQSAADGIKIEDWPYCLPGEGRFSIFGMLASGQLILSHVVALFAHRGAVATPLFLQLAKLPLQRIIYRALFAKYRFRNFWGRDDYNVEHIIRSQELRRIGGRHFGALHGLVAEPPITPVIRYIDFDTYYVFGRDWYERYYKSKWPEEMDVRVVGSSGMSRDQLIRLKNKRPNNIVCYVKEIFQDRFVFGEIKKIAEAFPDRKVIIKPKGKPVGRYREQLDSLLKNGPPNLTDASDRDSYDVMFDCSYALSESSTLVIEAIQFGLVSFAMVMDTRLTRNNYYRRFPNLVHENAKSIIEDIRAIEAGSRLYDRSAYKELVDLSGRVIWDTILSDMGVIDMAKPPLKHLNFVDPNRVGE